MMGIPGWLAGLLCGLMLLLVCLPMAVGMVRRRRRRGNRA